VSPGPTAEKIGKYEVIDLIGRGGMGTIFRARDPVLQRPVALKVISNLEVTPELRARFFREAQACARITPPNIVIIHDMGEDSGRLFIVMELLEGEELRRVIARQAQLSLSDKLDIVLQICDGLHFAHQKGVVHRDIKPANILLLRTGQVKILDFGIAQIAGAATQRDLTRTGMFMGTLRYMAPEQVRGQADRRSDLFSVAAVSYELLSGRPPFSGDDPLQILEQLRTTTPPRLTELDSSMPTELADVIAQALQKEPGDRFADLGQMGRRLDLIRRELVGDADREAVAGDKPRNRPSSLLGPPAPAIAVASAAPAPPAPPANDETPAIDAEPVIDAMPVIEAARTIPDARAVDEAPAIADVSTGRWRSDDAGVQETDREPVSRVPWIAVGTGAALAGLVAVALYVWLPAAPRGSSSNTPAATVPNAGATRTEAGAVKTEPAEEPARPAPTRDDATRPAAEKPRAADRPDAPAPAPRRTASTPTASAPPPAVAPSTPAASPGKTERSSVSPREPAKPAAPGAGTSNARDDAEQARSRMVAARQAAERVAAGFYARNRFNSAQSKEREAMAALGRSDYAAAVGLFGQAQSEYQAATAEAPREEENERQLARLKTSLDQAHAAVAARRQQALAAQADQLARDLFDQAQIRQVEGDGLASRKELAAAARAYQDAAERYGEATARARAARPAR